MITFILSILTSLIFSASEVVATTNHGKEIVAAIAKDNLVGLQFHPEKSQNPGLKIIRNFIEWDPMC